MLKLGLDIGANSIGWALLDRDNLSAAGVRVFPEGVGREQGREVSRNEARRVARGARRQTARRRRRRSAFRQALIGAGLLPEEAGLPANDARRVAWERDSFRAQDPYDLRRRAVGERLELYEIGRALLHLNKRRGFLSNRKADRASKDDDSAMLAEISDLAAAMGNRTLGQYLADLRGDNPEAYHRVRLRGRHTRRSMYAQEFDRIWETQRAHHPTLLTDALGEELRDIMFHQRPLLPPTAGLVGACELEPRLPRCPRADRRAQRFRLYLEVNNLRVLDTGEGAESALTPEQREKLLAYLWTAKDRSFNQIRKKLFPQHENIRFNLERGDRTKLKGMPSDALLGGKKLFGKAWHALDESLKDRIVAAIIDDEEPRLRHLLDQAGLDSQTSESLLDNAHLEDGYASYSLCAIKKLLPFVMAGQPLTSRDESVPCALRSAGYVMPWDHAAEQHTYLPESPELTNPLVRQALRDVRKVVNGILREHVYSQGRRLDAIHIELLREVKGTAVQRAKRSAEMRTRERERSAAADAIRELGHKVTRDAIERYLLWKEQGEFCAYSHPARAISIQALLGGEVDVDHILPYSKSLDNSLMNKVVAFRKENEAKGNRSVYEWLHDTDRERYDAVVQRARALPYPKLMRFYQAHVELDEFLERQFVDSAYIATQVMQYVRCLGADVVCVKGQHTAMLRRLWGLNSVLRTDQADMKNRDDHRHHAVDAIVVGLTDRKMLQALSRARHHTSGRFDLPEPWDGFRDNVQAAVNAIKVSHRVRRRVSGSLHDETIYGPTDDENTFVCRKPLESLSPAMIEKIRDKTVRELVCARVQAHGIQPGRGGGKIPPEVWAEPLTMPTRRDTKNPPVIKKVRILVPSESIRPIRGGRAFVQPGNTHHLCLFEIADDDGNTRRDAVFVSMIEAMERIRNREPVVQRVHPDFPDAKFLMSLASNELFLVEHQGEEDLYRFETAASTSKQMWFRHHTFAGKSSDKRCRISKMPNTFRGRKVTVDPLGRMRWAND